MKVLQFSGGKDSLACLLLLKDQLDEITVLWADSGDSFPETTALMEEVKAMCQNFVRVEGNQPKVIEDYGYPVDVLPMRCHAGHQHLAQQQRVKMQSFLECCSRSFLVPMHQKSMELGATTIIRGQKLTDAHKSPVRNGDVIDGVAYLFPIEDWTDEQVIEFIKDSPLFSAHYKHANTSMDCMHCTAYLAENEWKLPYLKKNYPSVGDEVFRRLKVIQSEIAKDALPLHEIIERNNHGF